MKNLIFFCLLFSFFSFILTVQCTGSFLHGVASGDPTSSSVYLWTRWTPSAGDTATSTRVFWRISKSSDLSDGSQLVQQGSFTTTADRDWTVKVRATSLRSNTRFFYGFSTEDAESPVGMTRTVPSRGDGEVPLNILLLSCANWRSGYFHAYRLAATSDDVDLLVHSGDFLYEFGPYAYPVAGQGAREGLLPAHETVTLADYRQRHALFRGDADLADLLRRAPLVAVWDDHDFADNSDTVESVNHQPACVDLAGNAPSSPDFSPYDCDQDEGSYADRVAAATRAFHEWLPVADKGSLDSAHDRQDITQVVQWGKLATLIGQDARVSARTCVSGCGAEWTDTAIPALAYANTDRAQYDDAASAFNQQVAAVAQQIAQQASNASSRMLSDAAVRRISDTFGASRRDGVPWQLLLSQSVFSRMLLPDLTGAAALFPAQIADGLNAILDAVFLDNTQQPPSYPFAFNVPSALLRASYAAQKHGVALTQDSWDGYTAQRAQLLEMLRQQTSNLVVLSGDSHNAFAFDLASQQGDPVGVEFNGQSVSSYGYETNTAPFWDLGLGSYGFQVWRAAWLVGNQGAMTYANPLDRGFVMVRVTPQAVTAEYHFISPNGAPWDRAPQDIHPVGSEALAQPTFQGGYYCEAMKTDVGTRVSSPVSSCSSTFGTGLDPLANAVNVVGSPASAISLSCMLAITLSVFFYLF